MKDLREILESIGYTDLVDYGQQYSTKPLYRDSDNKTALTINKRTGEWYDFVEKAGGSLDLLVQKTTSAPLSKEMLDSIGEACQFSRREAVELMDIKTFDKNNLIKLNKDHAYWIGRGVSKDTVSKFQGGTTNNGRMANRYVFPIFSDRLDLIGFSGRLLTKSDKYPKWKHLGKKSLWCYPQFLNQESIIKNRSVILVESIGDMLSLFEAGVDNVLVTFGIDINMKIIEFMLRINMSKIYIAFNNDKNNNFVGNRAAEDGKVKLSKFFDSNQISVALPTIKNDFGEMSYEEIIKWHKNLPN